MLKLLKQAKGQVPTLYPVTMNLGQLFLFCFVFPCHLWCFNTKAKQGLCVLYKIYKSKESSKPTLWCRYLSNKQTRHYVPRLETSLSPSPALQQLRVWKWPITFSYWTSNERILADCQTQKPSEDRWRLRKTGKSHVFKRHLHAMFPLNRMRPSWRSGSLG